MNKTEALQYLDSQQDFLFHTSDSIWDNPETDYHEEKSSAILKNALTEAGFTIRSGLAGIPTAFSGSYGSGKPVIGFLGEFDALSGLSQEAGITVTAVPGAAACITALTISGLPTRRFAFEAFLPQDKKERREILEELAGETRTLVLYEAPHRLVKTLRELLEALGDREASVCRELTKKHETIFRTTLAEALAWYEANDPRGECVLVIQGKPRSQIRQEARRQWEELSLEEHMAHYESGGMDRKEAMKQVAKDRGVSRRDVYQALLKK